VKAVLFDLDDTLYPEMAFVRGGFRAAARHLAGRHGLDTERLYEEMLDVLGRDGRGRVFDRVLEHHGLLSAEAVALMVYIYRTHRPSLRPDDDARATLEALRQADVRLGLVTDGMGSVQRRKIAALEIEDLFDAIVCTDELGAGCGKPSVLPFRIALELLEAPPGASAYVGDNPAKDFAGPNALGMLSIQVTRHAGAAAAEVPPEQRAAVVVDRLAEIVPVVEGC